MPETFGNYMDRHAGQQEMRGMNVPQVRAVALMGEPAPRAGEWHCALG